MLDFIFGKKRSAQMLHDAARAIEGDWNGDQAFALDQQAIKADPEKSDTMRCNFPSAGSVLRGVSWRTILSLVCPLLVACGPEVSGQPKPPPEFGAREGALIGCPSMEGLYAWPPVDGQYAKTMATNRQPWDGGRPVPVSRGRMQIKVEQTGSRLTIRSRDIAPGSVPSTQASNWAYVEYGIAQFNCRADMLEFEEVDYGDAANYGGRGARRGFTLALLKDGSLAVGIKTTSTGRTAAIFTWSDKSVGQYNMQDKVYWSWSKLQKLDPATN